jgi:hypothetical protein
MVNNFNCQEKEHVEGGKCLVRFVVCGKIAPLPPPRLQRGVSSF